MKRCDKITKNIQRKLLDFFQTKQGITLFCLSTLILVVFVLQLSDTLIEYHLFKPSFVSNKPSIDVVYTWVNGSDPQHNYLLKSYKYLNKTSNYTQVQLENAGQAENKFFCHYKFCIQTNNLIVIVPKLTSVDKQHFLLKSKTLLDQAIYSNLTIDSYDDIYHNPDFRSDPGVVHNMTLLHLNSLDYVKNNTLLNQLTTVFKLTLLNKPYKFYVGHYTIDCESSINCVSLDRTFVTKRYRTKPFTRDHLSFDTIPLANKIELPKIVKENIAYESDYDYEPDLAFDPSLETQKEKSKFVKKTSVRLKVFKVRSKEAEQYVNRHLIENEDLDFDFYQAYLVWDLGSPISDDASLNRFQDNDELKYSLRSLEKYAPWIGNVYIVTNGQIPNWLNVSNPRLKLVNHTDIFKNRTHLPTFNSAAIEAHLHRIKTLSDKFLYFNDDVLLGKEVYLEDFYTESKGFKFHLAWQLPGCNANCPNSWIRDGYCDKACNTTECDFDGGDCDFTKPRNSARDSFLNQSHLITSDFYCSPGCSSSWLADKYCDHPCNNLKCGYDMGDCGVINYNNLYQIKINKMNKKLFFETPRNISSFYFNFTMPNMTIIKADYEESKLVRTISVVNKFKILTVLLMPSGGAGELKINLEYVLNNSTLTSNLFIKLSQFDLKIEQSNIINVETKTKINLNLSQIEPISINNNNEIFSDYSVHKSYNFKLFDDLHVNYVGFLNWSLNNGHLTNQGYKHKLGFFNKKMSQMVSEYKSEPDPVNYVYQYLFKEPFMEKFMLKDYLDNVQLDDSNIFIKFRKRKLLDTFADSLKNVNKLYNNIYGFAARKVPAHMPHFIDKKLMLDLQHKFPNEFEETSSHKFRHKNDMQFSFSYYYFIMSEYEPANFSILFDELDTNKNGILDDLELKLINLRLYPKKFDTSDYEMTKLRPEFEAVLKDCYNLTTTNILERKNVTKCKNLIDYLLEKFWPGLPSEEKTTRLKYKFEPVGDDDTKFIMIAGDSHTVEVKLNNLLRSPSKFICLNDNIDYKLKNEARRLKNLINNFYQMMFPLKSSFEINESIVDDDMEKKNNFASILLLGLSSIFIFILCVLKRCCVKSQNGKFKKFRREYKVSNALRKRMEKKTETSSLSTSSENELESSGSFKKNFGIFMRSKFRNFKKTKNLNNLNTI